MSDASASQRLLQLLLAPGGPLDPERAPGWFAPAKLKAPFPWFGGKSRAAALIWSRLGEVVNYVEPFYGSGAVLLGRPHEPRVETVNDIDGMVVNFWRALRADPEAVAAACDWPVNEADLHARHRYLARVKRVISARCEADPFYSNATVAGWWVWGLSAWIGSGWCDESPKRQAPGMSSGGGGAQGVHSKAMRQPKKLPDVGSKAPTGETRSSGGRRGAIALAQQLPDLGGSGSAESGPFVNYGKGVNGAGMRRQLPSIGATSIGSTGRGTHGPRVRSALYEIFEALARRLRNVRVTCGDFERILTPAVTWKHGLTGVLLDPPYAGFDDLYGTAPVSERVRAWCIANGARPDLRIALCGYAGEHDELEALGWRVEAWKAAGGYANQSDCENENAAKERIWFSPACLSGEPVIEKPAEKTIKQQGFGW